MELAALLIFVVYALLIVVTVVAWFQGLILAFRASVILGIICFFIAPSYLIFGLVKWFAKVDLAQLIVDKFNELANDGR